MDRLTFEGDFCTIAMCQENPCPYDNSCTQREVWDRLKAYEDTGLEPEEIEKAMAISALREQEERENPKPLTLDELREMDGEPVWIDDWVEDSHGWELSEDASDYFDDDSRTAESYGICWVSYRSKPKEDGNDRS